MNRAVFLDRVCIDQDGDQSYDEGFEDAIHGKPRRMNTEAYLAGYADGEYERLGQ